MSVLLPVLRLKVEAVGAGVKTSIIIKNMRISQKNSALSSPSASARARRLGRYLSGCLSLISLVAISSGALFPGKNIALALPVSDEPITAQTAPTAAPSPTKINPVFNLNHVEGAGFTGVTSVDAFYPITQTPGQNLFFAVGSLNMNNTGNLGGGFQSGYRALLGDRMIWGLYGGVDVRSTAQNTFTQAGFGSELIGNKWGLHLNANVPLGDTTQTSSLGDAAGSTTGDLRFSGNELLLGSNNSSERSTAALTTVELNAGVQLLDLGEGSTLWGRGGVYYLGGAASSDTLGVRASLDHWPQNNIRLGLGVQHDSLFDTNVTMSANILLGAPSRRSARSPEERLWERASDPIVRTGTVLLEETVNVSGNGSNVVAINPETGQPYVFRHVDPALGTARGDSTAESPLNTLANVVGQTDANANNIIYVRAGNAGGAVTIPNGVQVLSVGPLQQIETQLGTVALPDSGSGILPTVRGTVTIGSDTLLSGLAIRNVGPSDITNNGISASGSNIVIEDNTITDAFRGIYLPDVDGDITIARNQIVDLRNDSIFFEDIESTDDTTITITDNTLSTTSGGRAIDFDGIAGSADITITNNNITTIEREGIYIGPITDNAVATVTVSNNQLPSIGADGISFNGIRNSATATLAIDNNTITSAGTNEGADGIIIDNIAGTVNVAATIENNTVGNASENGVQIARSGNSNLCLALNDNAVTAADLAGFDFSSTGNGAFQILNLDSVTTDNIGSFNPADIETNAAFVNGTANVAPCP